jgi:hypothetical protein
MYRLKLGLVGPRSTLTLFSYDTVLFFFLFFYFLNKNRVVPVWNSAPRALLKMSLYTFPCCVDGFSPLNKPNGDEKGKVVAGLLHQRLTQKPRPFPTPVIILCHRQLCIDTLHHTLMTRVDHLFGRARLSRIRLTLGAKMPIGGHQRKNETANTRDTYAASAANGAYLYNVYTGTKVSL